MTVPVLYIAGLSYSGSTILARTVGAAEGFFVAGELHYLWQRGVLEDGTCGCGAPFSRCEVWTAVLDQVRSEGGLDAQSMSRIEQSRVRARRAPLALARQRLGLPLERPLEGYVRTLAHLYRALRSVTGCTTIVDSSKDPYYGWALAHVPGLEVSVAHLVRDPRACEYSRARRHGPDGIALVKTALGWDLTHAAAEALRSDDARRYVRIRYEDFAARPHEIAHALRCMAGDRTGAAPAGGRDSVALGVDHTVSGNQNRFQVGEVEIRLDDAWRSGLAPGQRRLVTALTRPLLRRYGYAD